MSKVRQRTATAITGLGLWLSGAAPIVAQAPPTEVLQPARQTHDEMMRMLDQEFTQVPSALGLQSNGQLIQVFASRDGTTWRIVTTRPRGGSCIVALGPHWEVVPDPALEPLA